MLEVKSVSLQVGSTPLLTGVDLVCSAGSVTVLMGPNGAGKTSLLKTIAGEYPSFCGDILLDGKALGEWARADRAQFMAVLPQYSSLDFPFTVEEVVLLGRTPHATGLKRDREIVQASLERVDSAYLARRPYPQLSGGEKQRVQLARVLAQVWQPVEQRAGVLLLDEPSASLDLAHQQLLRSIVKDFAANGGTVVMVVHDLKSGGDLCRSIGDDELWTGCSIGCSRRVA